MNIHGSIIRIGSKMLIPYILLLALYVQFHGDYGPGGGFQAGVIFAAAFILYALTHGLKATTDVVPAWVAEKLVAAGVLLYAGVGVVSMLKGGNFLEYAVFDHHHPSHGQHTGLLLIELGVGITVFAVMLTIFYNFAARGRS